MYDEFAPEFTSDEFLMNSEPEEEEEEVGGDEGDLDGEGDDLETDLSEDEEEI